MALTYLNNTKTTNNIWLTPRSATYDPNLAVSQTVTGGYPALYHSQHYLVNGSILLTNNAYQTYSQAAVFANLTLAANQIGNSVNLTNVSENVSIAFINYGGGAASTILGTGSTYGNQNVIYFNTNAAIVDATGNQVNSNLNPGTWGGFIAMHEQLHVLGLANKGTGDHGVLIADLRNTIMQYPLGGYTTTTVKIPLTPGMQDISDLQNGNSAKGIAALGASTTSNGNDSYDFTQTTTLGITTGTVKLGNLGNTINIAPTNAVMTIWDSAGTDKIDASGMTTSNYINLNGGQFSSIGSNKNIAPTGAIGSVGYGTEYNVGIAIGALIENATGGSAADTIVGNALANTILAGGGNDTIIGSAGSDTIYGQAGADVFKYLIKSDGADTIRDFSLGDKIDLSLIDFNPALAGVQHVTFTQLSFVGTANGIPINFLSADYNGDNLSDFSLTLTGVTSVSTSDFILI
jgi:serralysin